MNKTVLIAALREGGIINAHDILKRFGTKGTDVAISYTPSGGMDYAHTSVFSPSHQTDPEAGLRRGHHKTFSGKRDVSFPEAKAWATEKYGITEWETFADYTVPTYVMDAARAFIAASPELVKKVARVEAKTGGLKFWSGSGGGRSIGRGSWDRWLIAAHSQKDAMQIYVETGGSERGIDTEFRDHVHNGWGTGTEKLIPNPKRGTYLVDRHLKAVMFIEPKSRSIVDEAPAEAVAAAATQPIPKEYGTLRVGFQRGVRVDEWTYESPHHDRAHGDQIKAEVRMRHADRSGRLVDGKGIEFVATSKAWDGEIVSPDIEKLFASVTEAFQTYDLARRGIVWEDWFEIVVAPASERYHRDEGESAGFSVTYRVIKRGVDPRDAAKIYTLGEYNSVGPFPTAKAAQVVKDDEDEEEAEERDPFRRDASYQYAYLPATPENRAALDAIRVAIETARARLTALLVQDSIGKTLARIPTLNLLEAK